MFNGMEDLPIKYFDTHNHGDIMSYYTNDIDTLRQMISQSFPQLLISAVTVITVFCDHAVLQRLAGSGGGGRRNRHDPGHPESRRRRPPNTLSASSSPLARTEGFMEEMMNGQKVVKVFCHEEEAKADFDRINDELFREC